MLDHSMIMTLICINVLVFMENSTCVNTNQLKNAQLKKLYYAKLRCDFILFKFLLSEEENFKNLRDTQTLSEEVRTLFSPY